MNLYKKLGQQLAKDDKPFKLRQGKVISNQGTTITITVGDSATQHVGIHFAGGTGWTPTTGDVIWVAKQGAMLFVLAKNS